jgi:hypothetical protein
MLGLFRFRVPGSGTAAAPGRHQQCHRRVTPKPAEVEGLMPSGRTLRRLAFAVLVVAGTAAASPGLRTVLPGRAGAVFRLGRGSLPVWLRSGPRRPKACRTGCGWCCRASFRISAGARRLRRDRVRLEGWPRPADRSVEGDGRLSPRRHQLRDVPRGQLPDAPDEPPTIVACGRLPPDVAAGLRAIPVQGRRRSALQCRHDPR